MDFGSRLVTEYVLTPGYRPVAHSKGRLEPDPNLISRKWRLPQSHLFIQDSRQPRVRHNLSLRLRSLISEPFLNSDDVKEKTDVIHLSAYYCLAARRQGQASALAR